MKVPHGDAALMALFLQKEPKAASELYNRIASRIYGLGLSLLRNKTDTEDLVQDTFLKVWRTGAASIPSERPSRRGCCSSRRASRSTSCVVGRSKHGS